MTWTDRKGHWQERTMATAPFTEVSTLVEAKDGHVHTHAEGAIFVLLRKSSTSGQPSYSDMTQLVAHNSFPSQFPENVRRLDFPWVKVEDRPWAHGGFKVRVYITV